MITFLPVPDFKLSAKILDWQRLNKQRTEVVQILGGLHNSGLKHHVAVRMWRGYTDALVAYGLAICDEWILQGHKDNQYDKIQAYGTVKEYALPLWLGRESFHASHRANLLRKDPKFYGAYGWKDFPFLSYEWPMNIPEDVLKSLRQRGYEPLAQGTTYEQAIALVKTIPEATSVAACQCLYYPVKLKGR